MHLYILHAVLEVYTHFVIILFSLQCGAIDLLWMIFKLSGLHTAWSSYTIHI